MKNMQVLASAFLGGMLVAVAGMSNLLLHDTHPVAAAVLFGVMLLSVLTLDLHLMTAKAGYLFWDSSMIRTRAVHLVLTFCGNAVAVVLLGIAGNLVGAVVMSLLYEYKKSADEVYREQQEAEEAAERHHAHRHHHHSHESEE